MRRRFLEWLTDKICDGIYPDWREEPDPMSILSDNIAKLAADVALLAGTLDNVVARVHALEQAAQGNPEDVAAVQAVDAQVNSLTAKAQEVAPFPVG